MQYQEELEKTIIPRKNRKRRPRAWKKIWIRKIRIRQEREKERKEREKERELNFKLEKLKLQHTVEHSSIRTEFDAAKNIRLVPKCQEQSLDKYLHSLKN